MIKVKAFTLVLKNFSRKKTRLIMSSTGLMLAIALIMSTFTVSSSLQLQIGEEIEKYGPNIVVTPKSESISVPYGNVIVGDVRIPESTVQKIYGIPNNANLRIVSPKIYGQVDYQNSSLFVVGMISEQEAESKKWWSIQGSLPQNDSREALVGSEVKQGFELQLGSTIEVNGFTFIIKGLLGETGSIDDYSFFLPLHTAQELLNLSGVLSVIDISALCNTCPVEVMSQQIMDAVHGVKATPIKQAVETRISALEETANFSLLLSSIILVAGCAGIINTMLASVHERIREIGILMSLGADDLHLFRIFILESLLLGTIGGLIGSILGLALSTIIGPLFMNVTIHLAALPFYALPVCLALSVAVCVGASLYPAWRASKIDPVRALRTL
ncbi:MAG: ABC transporter permease [Candidatus Bathyarchaeota archaeon]|nr:MAG: ABC transporter permease [Candidatus Bathyarchaeota archaeon]